MTFQPFVRGATIALALLVTACATTHDPGWSGSGATPFDTARSQCRAEAEHSADAAERESAFTACMARHGWRR